MEFGGIHLGRGKPKYAKQNSSSISSTNYTQNVLGLKLSLHDKKLLIKCLRCGNRYSGSQFNVSQFKVSLI
jgi:hypothetical protein